MASYDREGNNDGSKEQKKAIFTGQEELAEQQIVELRKTVDYDTAEYTVGFLVQEFTNEALLVPDYQRKFVWDSVRKSKFIESMILGLPIPFMFVADMQNGVLEIVDGVQRIQTLQQFSNNELKLRGLEKLDHLNEFRFADLPDAQQRKFRNRSLRIIVLSDKTDEETRRDLFRRINTGSEELREAELRKGAYSGPFYELVQECAKNEEFRELCPMNDRRRDRGEGEELVLRFFAYSERYQEFQHSVKGFLNDYLRERNVAFDEAGMQDRFTRMLRFVAQYFPYGFRKGEGLRQTPRVRFEAIAVGVDLALHESPDLGRQEYVSGLNPRHSRFRLRPTPATRRRN